MGSNNYYVDQNICGIVGGIGNTVNNTIQTGQSIFDDAGMGDTKLKAGHHNILVLQLLDKYIEPLIKEVDDALCIGRYPLKIQITDLVNDCANGTYYNDGNLDSEVKQMINCIFSLICAPLGFDYKAKIARVGLNYFFEMYPDD